MTKTLYYVGDPMCSWCWGFQPVLDQVKVALPEDLPVVYVMGGLAKDSDEPMPDEIRGYVQNAWRAVSKETGAQFNWDFWEKCQPRRSTYPSCRAFYAAQMQAKGVAMFEAIQHAYYQEARNPSDVETLVEIAGEIGLDSARFAKDLASAEIEQQMQDGFNVRRSMNANEFPSMVIKEGDSAVFLVKGFDDAETILGRLDAVLVS